MYVKIHISKLGMSQKIHFWHQNLLKITFFEKKQKHFFWSKKNFKLPTKRNFDLQMLQLLENHLKTTCIGGVFLASKSGLNFENFDQKVPKKSILSKKSTFMALFGPNFPNLSQIMMPKNGFSGSFPFSKCILLHSSVKVTAFCIFQNFWVGTINL